MIITLPFGATVPKTPRPDWWYKYAGKHFDTVPVRYSARTRGPVWVTVRGEAIQLSEMSDIHLRNLYNLIQREWVPRIDREENTFTAEDRMFIESWQSWILFEMGRREMVVV